MTEYSFRFSFPQMSAMLVVTGSDFPQQNTTCKCGFSTHSTVFDFTPASGSSAVSVCGSITVQKVGSCRSTHRGQSELVARDGVCKKADVLVRTCACADRLIALQGDIFSLPLK